LSLATFWKRLWRRRASLLTHDPACVPVVGAASIDSRSKADVLLAEGLEHFRERRFGLAYEKFCAQLVEMGRSDLISRDMDDEKGVFGATSSDEAIRGYLERQAVQWKGGVTPLPAFLNKRLGGARPNLKETSILLLFSQYTYNDSRFMQNDMIDHFYETARGVGLKADLFFVDECSYPGLALTTQAQASARLLELKTRIEESKPDFIFFDAQYIGSEKTLNREFFEDIKRRTDIRLIGAMCNAWQSVCIPMAEYWLPVLDTMYYFAPGSPLETLENYRKKLVWSGFLVNRDRFFECGKKEISVSFYGTYDFGNRAFWLSVAAETASKCGIGSTNLKAHDRTGDQATIEAYAEAMRASEIVLNLPMRYNGAYAVTGRIWQALHCGALVLEEYTDLTAAYFVPYVHYVPFRSAEEFARLLRFFHENEAIARSIGEEAARFVAVEYCEERIWSDILSGAGH
jgi:hypothetical protein